MRDDTSLENAAIEYEADLPRPHVHSWHPRDFEMIARRICEHAHGCKGPLSPEERAELERTLVRDFQAMLPGLEQIECSCGQRGVIVLGDNGERLGALNVTDMSVIPDDQLPTEQP